MKLDVQYVAALAQLEITPDKLPALQADMDHILQVVESLPAVDCAPPQAPLMTLREDAVSPSFSREDMLRNAPAVQDGYVLVPKTVE